MSWRRKWVWLAALCAVGLLGLSVGCSRQEGGVPDVKEDVQTYPISFVYGGRASEELLPLWAHSRSETEETDHRLITDIWQDPETGLCITVETKHYNDSDAREWVAAIEQRGESDSLILEDFHIADLVLPIGGGMTEKVTLAYSKGTDVKHDDFLFQEVPLNMYSNRTLKPSGGRSSSGDCMPYFNLHTQTQGYILAVGWTGQWQTSFRRTTAGVQVQSGMEKTHFFLYPGERVRTPSFALLHWQGREEDSYNQWRGFMLAHHTPKDLQGRTVVLPLTNGAWGGDPLQNHLSTIAYISSMDYDYDAYWVDAGWFGDQSRHSTDQFGDAWFKNAGDWYHNTTLYPDGLAPVSEAAHEAGMDFLLWFEPERSWWDAEIVQSHPEWFLKTDVLEDTSYLFNLGDPQARQWMTVFISAKLNAYHVDIYRQDFNIDPLPFWENVDTPDRQGITEMKYIEGLYAYLDGLLENNPELILDNCAGGGRRLDYEILSRALPMFRSDYQCFPDYQCTSVQIQTDGLSRWVPLNGTCVQFRPGDTYSFRSNLAYAVQYPASAEQAWQQKMNEEFHLAQPYFAGEYYMLTDGDIGDNTQWYAYQMNRTDLSGGFVLAFRRENARQETQVLQMRVPSDAKAVRFTDRDTGESWTQSIEAGSETAELGLRMENTKESKLIFYEILW